MAYSNNFNRGNYNKGFGNFAFTPMRNQSRSYGAPLQPREYVKRYAPKSGAKWHEKNGKVFITAWKVVRGEGLLSFIASPTKKTAIKKGEKNGREWGGWIVNITKKRTGETYAVSGMYDASKRRVYIPEMGIMLSPNSPNGGYAGSYKRKDRK